MECSGFLQGLQVAPASGGRLHFAHTRSYVNEDILCIICKAAKLNPRVQFEMKRLPPIWRFNEENWKFAAQ